MSLRPSAVAAQIRIETILTLRRGESLVVTLGIPVGILAFFGKVHVLDIGRDPLGFLVPGTLALAVLSTAMVSLGIATGFERRYGVLKRLGSTPLGRTGLLAAKTITVIAIELLQTVVLVVVGLALGWSPAGGFAAAVGLMILGTIAFASLGLLMAGSLRAEATLAVANAAFLGLIVLGAIAYPLAMLPSVLRGVADLLPAAPLSECLRGVLSGTGLPGGHFAVLCAWTVASPLLAARFFTWEER